MSAWRTGTPRAIAKSAFRGLTCGDGKQQTESDHPSHRSGGPPAWRAVDGSEVRAMRWSACRRQDPLTTLGASRSAGAVEQVRCVYEDFATALTWTRSPVFCPA